MGANRTEIIREPPVVHLGLEASARSEREPLFYGVRLPWSVSRATGPAPFCPRR